MLPTYRFICSFLLCIFIFTSVSQSQVSAAKSFAINLPAPGKLVPLSNPSNPALLSGIVIDPKNALQFDFLINQGDKKLSESQKRDEYYKLIKYFLASLTVPDSDQWVNLSPYEHSRIIEASFGETEMGRDLLAQDYLLKQIMSSMMYPESALGKRFWDRVYTAAHEKFGHTNIPVETFNKVWIVPEQAVIFENGNTAFIASSHLKVMLEEDYLSKQKNLRLPGDRSAQAGGSEVFALPAATGEDAAKKAPPRGDGWGEDKVNTVLTGPASLTRLDPSTLTSNIIREVLIPELTKEVNEGENFAQLRQVFSAMILATWYKGALKESLLGKVYADQAKVNGVNQSPANNEAIYQQYVAAFKKGVYNYIKEEPDQFTNQSLPRKYFSGGVMHGKNFMKIEQIGLDQMQAAMVENPLLDMASVSLIPQEHEIVVIPKEDVIFQLDDGSHFDFQQSVRRFISGNREHFEDTRIATRLKGKSWARQSVESLLKRSESDYLNGYGRGVDSIRIFRTAFQKVKVLERILEDAKNVTEYKGPRVLGDIIFLFPQDIANEIFDLHFLNEEISDFADVNKVGKFRSRSLLETTIGEIQMVLMFYGLKIQEEAQIQLGPVRNLSEISVRVFLKGNYDLFPQSRAEQKRGMKKSFMSLLAAIARNYEFSNKSVKDFLRMREAELTMMYGIGEKSIPVLRKIFAKNRILSGMTAKGYDGPKTLDEMQLLISYDFRRLMNPFSSVWKVPIEDFFESDEKIKSSSWWLSQDTLLKLRELLVSYGYGEQSDHYLAAYSPKSPMDNQMAATPDQSMVAEDRNSDEWSRSLMLQPGEHVHPLNDIVDGDLGEVDELNDEQAQLVEDVLRDIHKHARRISDKHMITMVEQFVGTGARDVIKSTFWHAMLKGPKGVASRSGEIIIHTDLLNGALTDSRYVPSLKSTLIHELNHQIDFGLERSRGVRYTSAQLETSAIIRTAAYFGGKVVEDQINGKWVVLVDIGKDPKTGKRLIGKNGIREKMLYGIKDEAYDAPSSFETLDREAGDLSEIRRDSNSYGSQQRRDSAQFSRVTPGGIDLNATNMDMIIKRDGKGVPLPLEHQDMALLSKISGFVPEIMNIQPASILLNKSVE